MALVLLALGLSAGGAAAVLCPSANHGGAFIGMASDTSSYTVTPAQDGRDDVAVRRDTNSYYVKVKLNPAQVWTLVDEAKPPPGGAVVHSFTGKYLQVLPDNGDNYNEVHSYESFVSSFSRPGAACSSSAPAAAGPRPRRGAISRWRAGPSPPGGSPSPRRTKCSRDPPPPSLGGRLLGRQSKLIFYHSKLRALDLRVSPFVYYYF